MPQTVIENPIINSPYLEPTRHFKFSDEGITNEIVEERRKSSYFVPIAQPRKKGTQLSFDTEWTGDRIEENKFINQVRERVEIWRKGGYQGITNTTRILLDYWKREERERKLLYCQIEAAETAIYLTEVARKYGDSWIENEIRQFNSEANPLLYRVAFKMATGSGKTIVMAMFITWHVLNKVADPKNADYTDSFLVVTPGITIRDRLRVLLPSDPQNFYKSFDLIPPIYQEDLGKAKIVVTNYHSFLLREKTAAGKITKSILRTGENSRLPNHLIRW